MFSKSVLFLILYMASSKLLALETHTREQTYETAPHMKSKHMRAQESAQIKKHQDTFWGFRRHDSATHN